MDKRKIIDNAFRYLTKLISFTSVVALAAIIGFVFFQGVAPFIFPTETRFRLVAENIDRLTVNGTVYENHRTFIHLEPGTDLVQLEFVNRGQPAVLRFRISSTELDPAKAVAFEETSGGTITYPEAYVYSASYPGLLPGLEQKIHLIMPEPPYGVWTFLSGQEWRPTYSKIYGIMPMILATIFATIGAVALGVPIAILAAVFMAEFIPSRRAAFVRGAIDLLAGIPSVVYGFFGLMVVVPFIKDAFGAASGNSLLAAMIILSIMILPTVIAISETSMRAVPQIYREASLALGATKMQTAWKVVFPAARSGIIAGIILGISRAVGETMAVILVAGNSPQIPRSLVDSVRTLTATIALEMGYAHGRHSQMLFSVGVVLFVIILALNAVIMHLRKRMPEYK